jgi:hypothetical protein
MSVTDRWWERANCRGKADLFFPPNPRTAPAVIRKAQLYCAVCPVLAQCAEAGKNENFGVWGGVSKYKGRDGADMRLVACCICGVTFPGAYNRVTCSAECAKARRRDLEREAYERRKQVLADAKARYDGARYAANRDHVREVQRVYYETNSDEILAKRRERRREQKAG